MQVESWRDKYPMCWRIETILDNKNYQEEKTFLFAPYCSEAIDPSWKESEDSWNWFKRDCIVIADFFDNKWEITKDEIEEHVKEYACRNIELISLNASTTQGRFDMGEINFPDETQKVDNLVKFLKIYASSLNWADTLLLEQKI